MHKKGVVEVLVIIIIIIIILWIATAVSHGAGRECRKDSDCSSESYCSSDFECHKIPVIEKTTITNIHEYNSAAWILAFAIIVAAIIIRWDTLRKALFKEPPHKEEY